MADVCMMFLRHISVYPQIYMVFVFTNSYYFEPTVKKGKKYTHTIKITNMKNENRFH